MRRKISRESWWPPPIKHIALTGPDAICPERGGTKPATQRKLWHQRAGSRALCPSPQRSARIF